MDAVVVIGAGVTGLVTARELAAAGMAVTVVETDTRAGGRLATWQGCDSGAQFFTVRSPRFGSLVEGWLEAKVAREWCRGFTQPPDGYPRYVGTDGMVSIADGLAAGLALRLSCAVTAVTAAENGRWRLVLGGDETVDADHVICSLPAPEALRLFVRGDTPLTRAAQEALARNRYLPALALLALLDRAPSVPAPGGVQLTDGPVSWIADNQAKGISQRPALTMHASPDWSAAHWDDASPDSLIALARPWLGAAQVLDARLVRWPCAQPVEPLPERCVEVAPRLWCAGDGWGEARVEGAALSGWAAADAVLAS